MILPLHERVRGRVRAILTELYGLDAATIGVPIDTDYRYVANDLRKIAFTGGSLIAVLLALSFVVAR